MGWIERVGRKQATLIPTPCYVVEEEEEEEEKEERERPGSPLGFE